MKTLHLQNITQIYKGNNIPTLKNLSVSFDTGKLYSILGENGSGKSTLLKVLSSSIDFSSGEIFFTDSNFIEEKNYSKKNHKNIQAELKKHVGIIQQKPVLCSEATVLEHTILSSKIYNIEILKNKIKTIFDFWNFSFDDNFLDCKVEHLTDSQQFYTSLLCVLLKNPDFLLIDEPASLLNTDELLLLENSLKKFCSQDKAVILVTHSISQAERLSEHLIVIKKESTPQHFSNLSRKEILFILDETQNNKANISSSKKNAKEKKEFQFSKFIFSISNLSTKKIKNINFNLCNSQVAVIYGLSQDGIEDLENVLCGFAIPKTGTAKLNSTILEWGSPSTLQKNKIRFISSESTQTDSSPQSFIYELLTTDILKKTRLFISSRKLKKISDKIIAEENFPQKPSAKQKVFTLSGGMRQRLIIKRELNAQPDILILAQPDKGLDRKSLKSFQKKLLELCATGMSTIILTKNKELYRFPKTENVVFYKLNAGKLC